MGTERDDPTSTSDAAAVGATATRRFSLHERVVPDTSPERVSMLVREVLDAIHGTITRHQVTYDEYNALKAWLIRVGEDGEWPLFLDTWIEHVVERVNSASRPGSRGTIEGPFYVPGAPEAGAEATMPMREDEEGTPLLFRGRVTDVDGRPLGGSTIDIWQADSAGRYSHFAPGVPEWNLRSVVTTDAEGRFRIHTVRPAPYQIPTDGSCGALIRAAGWHPWRPAHLHVKVSSEGHQEVTTQLYFPDDSHNGDDVSSAVKPELVMKMRRIDGTLEVTYDFSLTST